MPSTPTYGLPFEAPGDLPGHTLDGGTAGNQPILAEAVETELVRVEQAIADLRTEALRGWRPIADGAEESVGFFDIDLTAGGDFPAGTFGLVRIHLRGQLTVNGGNIWARVNNSGNSDHRWGMVVTQLSNGTVADSGRGDSNEWRLAEWSSSPSSTCTVTLYRTDGAPGIISYQSQGGTYGGTSNHLVSVAAGRLMMSQTLSSLRIGGSIGGGQFDNVRWWAEGYRP